MKDDRLYEIYILECIDRIEQYTAEWREAFFADARTQDAVLRNLQTLAESIQRLSANMKAAHPEIDGRGISGLRNILVHDYNAPQELDHPIREDQGLVGSLRQRWCWKPSGASGVTVDRVTQVWSAAITSVRLADGGVYRVAVIAGFSRSVLS